MKILVIIGSPRKWNTYHTVYKIEQVHRKLADCEYEYMFLKAVNLRMCKGCSLCISKGEQLCPLEDDRRLIAEKIQDADGVILACPNYITNVPALMKNCLDRFAYTCHRPTFFGQRFMLVVTSGGFMGVKPAMRALSLLASGGRIVGRLCAFHPPEISDKMRAKEAEKIKRAAEKFARATAKEKADKPPFSHLIWFSVFKASSAINKTSLPADYQYYKDRAYFTEERLNLFQRAAIKIFTAFFRFLFNRGLI